MFNIKALTGKQFGSRKTRTERQKKASGIHSSTSDIHETKTFSKSFEQVQEQVFIEDMHQFITEIQQQGDILKRYPNQQEFMKYKILISNFLKKVVGDSIRINKKQIHHKNQEQVTADIINEKVYQLGQYLLLEEEDTLEVAAAIDEIRGLLFDSFETKLNSQ